MADAYSNTVRIGYARVSGHSQDHQLQLDALAGADCREGVVQTASSRGDRPKLRATLKRLKAGDTLVIYKPDRVARSMKELLVLLEDELHARDVCRRSSDSSLADDFHRWHPGFDSPTSPIDRRWPRSLPQFVPLSVQQRDDLR